MAITIREEFCDQATPVYSVAGWVGGDVSDVLSDQIGEFVQKVCWLVI